MPPADYYIDAFVISKGIPPQALVTYPLIGLGGIKFLPSLIYVVIVLDVILFGKFFLYYSLVIFLKLALLCETILYI